ncbi:hypothetical protein K443DRAFT_11433 [Laccaria amethystina LaAM-08-1]|uniref:Uncharacterized protein n=1 Tax=Laccaria amethystina LaAM-08-1 TaxID=1095629 RepID=A0A0C9XGZ3_9AGAR|nr:hypothetical protein K443DRAFT_11433 [Laccaria amethystina LaAM-08-1]
MFNNWSNGYDNRVVAGVKLTHLKPHQPLNPLKPSLRQTTLATPLTKLPLLVFLVKRLLNFETNEINFFKALELHSLSASHEDPFSFDDFVKLLDNRPSSSRSFIPASVLAAAPHLTSLSEHALNNSHLQSTWKLRQAYASEKAVDPLIDVMQLQPLVDPIPHTMTGERTLANPDARFGVTNNANLPLPTTTIHDNHPPPPTTNTLTPLPSTTPTATTTTTVTVVVLHKPRHHQTADVACQRACQVDGDSQDAKRDPAAPDFEDHTTKERGKGGKGATGGQGNKGPATARTSMQDHAHPFTRGPNDEGQRRHRPPPMGTTTDVDGPPPHPRMLTAHPPTEDEHAQTAATPPPTYGGRRPPPWMDDESHPVDGQPPPTNDNPKPPPPAPATPYGRPPLVNHDCPRTKTAHRLR